MNHETRYHEGQRWGFAPEVPEFETTFVIGRIVEAHPEWGPAWNETRYEVYVRYSSLRELLIESMPSHYDGVVLSLTEEGLDRSVTRLVESEVSLPWWWVYGRRFASQNDVDCAQFVAKCEQVSEALPSLFTSTLNIARALRQRTAEIEEHMKKFPRPTISRKTESKSVAESWTRIETWLAEFAPNYQFDLNPGAKPREIAAFEDEIGMMLPDDFKESLLIHDGGDCQNGNCYLPGEGDFMPLSQILDQWKMYRRWQEDGYGAGADWIPTDISGPIKPVFWNTKRIYITDNSGNHLTLDLDPPPNGKYGQIVYHCHEVGPTDVIAPSWSDFLKQMVSDLESGKFVYSEKWHTLELLNS